MSQELTVYDIFQGQQVRKVVHGDGKLWRVYLDCCKVLGFSNPSKTAQRIPKQHLTLSYVLAPDGKRYKHRLIDEEGLISLIAYSRLPKEQLDAFREVIGHRAAAPQKDAITDSALSLQALKVLIDNQIAMQADLKEVKGDIAELKAAREPLLLKPVINYNERVRLVIHDWVEVHADNPRVTYQSVHSRLNTCFLYKHGHNISDMGKKRGKSALQVAIDIGMGAEILSLAQDLVANNFEGHFDESEAMLF